MDKENLIKEWQRAHSNIDGKQHEIINKIILMVDNKDQKLYHVVMEYVRVLDRMEEQKREALIDRFEDVKRAIIESKVKEF